MPEIDISSVDLNLLTMLDAVLETRSATRAARRLHVTQPAVSSALRRARALFADPLVVRTGRGFAPTPRAAALAPQIRAILDAARGLFDARFDPATCDRTFTIACADSLAITCLPAVLARLSEHMPKARAQTLAIEHVVGAGGLPSSDADVAIGAPPAPLPGCFDEPLFEDPWRVLADAAHPDIGARLSRARYAALPHAELALFGAPERRVDDALAAHGLTRAVEVSVGHIAALPFVVAGTRRVATVTRTLTDRFADHLGLRVLRPPVSLEPLRVSLMWTPRVDADPAVAELRAVIHAALDR